VSECNKLSPEDHALLRGLKSAISVGSLGDEPRYALPLTGEMQRELVVAFMSEPGLNNYFRHVNPDRPGKEQHRFIRCGGPGACGGRPSCPQASWA
jgi:hypothetical protein